MQGQWRLLRRERKRLIRYKYNDKEIDAILKHLTIIMDTREKISLTHS